jgi:hypothetical protein
VTVKDNTIRGNGGMALQIGLYASAIPNSAVGNAFIEHDVGRFSPVIADIYLDINASNTQLCDQPGGLIDNGSNTLKACH